MMTAALTRARVGVATVVAVVAVTVAACGAEEAPPEPSALDDYLAELAYGLDSDEWVTAVADAEAVIATCMVEAGFEYRPLAAPQGVYTLPPVLTPEYAAEFGYGWTTETLGPNRPPQLFSQQSGDDPAEGWNTTYVNGLSPQAQEEYWAAMRGPGSDGDDLEAIEGDAALGCEGRAHTEVYAQVQPPERLQMVMDEIWAALGRIETDPRVEATVPAWANCMADAGYLGMTTLADTQLPVLELVNAFPAPGDMSWEEMTVAYGSEIAQLQETEIAIAVADTTCREEVGWYEARALVQPEVEDEVLGDYQAEMDALLEWMRERRTEEQ